MFAWTKALEKKISVDFTSTLQRLFENYNLDILFLSKKSVITNAAMDSTMGTARGKTQGSCLPLPLTCRLVSLFIHTDLILHDRRYGFERHVKINVFPIGNPSLNAARKICSRPNSSTFVVKFIVMF